MHKQQIAGTNEHERGVLMKNINIIVVVLVVLCLVVVQSSCAATAQEQQPPMSPEEMKPHVEAMFKVVIEVYSSPDMAKSQVTFYRNFYKALIETGFTEEEALQIVIPQGSILGAGQQ
jgi:hypothetical protein